MKKNDMKRKKEIAIKWLNRIKEGFFTELELHVIRQMIIGDYEAGFITKKDCGILTNLCDEYDFDNFYSFEI